MWGIASAIFGIAAFRKRRSVKRRIAEMPTGDPAPVQARRVIMDGVPVDPPRQAPRDDLGSILGVGSLQPADPPPHEDDDEPMLH